MAKSLLKSYRVSPLAEADLGDIWFYTFKHRSIEQADSYHRALVAALEGLAAGTKLGRSSMFSGYKKYLCGSHVIYFQEHDDRIDVIRILHHKQDAERHL